MTTDYGDKSRGQGRGGNGGYYYQTEWSEPDASSNRVIPGIAIVTVIGRVLH